MSATRVGGPVLSGEQAAAAHAGPQGAFLIAAGPGTGKTFTATERFCWLVEQGVAPDQILTVTFSDRAAEELRVRITRELSAWRTDLIPGRAPAVPAQAEGPRHQPRSIPPSRARPARPALERPSRSQRLGRTGPSSCRA